MLIALYIFIGLLITLTAWMIYEVSQLTKALGDVDLDFTTPTEKQLKEKHYPNDKE